MWQYLRFLLFRRRTVRTCTGAKIDLGPMRWRRALPPAPRAKKHGWSEKCPFRYKLDLLQAIMLNLTEKQSSVPTMRAPAQLARRKLFVVWGGRQPALPIVHNCTYVRVCLVNRKDAERGEISRPTGRSFEVRTPKALATQRSGATGRQKKRRWAKRSLAQALNASPDRLSKDYTFAAVRVIEGRSAAWSRSANGSRATRVTRDMGHRGKEVETETCYYGSSSGGLARLPLGSRDPLIKPL